MCIYYIQKKTRHNEVQGGSQLIRYNHYSVIANVHFCQTIYMQEKMCSPPTLTETRENKKKQAKNTAKHRYSVHSKRLIHDHSTVHKLTAQFAEKRSLIDFFSLLPADGGFFSCSRDFEFVLAVILSYKEGVHQVFRIPVQSREEHPHTLLGDAHPRGCCQAPAVVLARSSS